VKALPFALFLVFTLGTAQAQTPDWQPSAGHTQVAIWPGTPPDLQPVKGPERTEITGPHDLVAGKPYIAIYNVTKPTMTVYSPTGHNTGAAVVVYPGGGYEILAIDLEGTEACDWLTAKGITCIVLKYRVPAPRSAPNWGAYPQSPIALEDAQRTLGLVRLHAAEWHIDPHKIGVLGFSAGGHLVAAAAVRILRLPSIPAIFRSAHLGALREKPDSRSTRTLRNASLPKRRPHFYCRTKTTTAIPSRTHLRITSG